MGLSCACDFDKSECESWYEPGGKRVPPVGETCCECAAPLPAGEKAPCIVSSEVYEPDEPEPRDPYEAENDETVSDDELAEIERLHDAWRERTGWDGDTERHERVRSTDYRCERCADLAEAIEDLGYCMIAPGDLADCHTDYVAESGGHEVMWKPDAAGVWQPRRMTRWDFARRELISRRNRLIGFTWHGGWRTWLRWRVGFRLESAVMRRLGYSYRTLSGGQYFWQR